MSEDSLAPKDTIEDRDAKATKEDRKDELEAIIPEEVEELLEEMPEAQQKAVKAILLGVSYQRHWRGPLPPPEVLSKYNDAFPNGAERIFLEGQKQTDHRIAMEKTVVPETQKQSRRGQTFAFIIAMAFLAASFVLILQGHDIAGTVVGSIDLVALVTVFIVGRSTQRRDINS